MPNPIVVFSATILVALTILFVTTEAAHPRCSGPSSCSELLR